MRERKPARNMVHALAALAGVLLIILSVGLPSAIVLKFSVQRAYIEKELCVMRDAAPELNTCHGSCYLMKQLRKLEQQEKEPFVLLEERTGPAIMHRTGDMVAQEPAVVQHPFPELVVGLSTGWCLAIEPVPWG
ncbi:MAG: hypothetical protein KDB88_01970 [Flavobacteriales bacterium]|nr:hypothetical protein [Flavobacteriales bacterium]